jgi:hypothetical protein
LNVYLSPFLEVRRDQRLHHQFRHGGDQLAEIVFVERAGSGRALRIEFERARAAALGVASHKRADDHDRQKRRPAIFGAARQALAA